MKGVVKKDRADIFPHFYEGTVLREVSEKGENYVGLFISMFGSYYVEIPKKRCKKYKIKKTLNGQLVEWLRR